MIFERNLLQTLTRYRRAYTDIIDVLAARHVVHQSRVPDYGLRVSLESFFVRQNNFENVLNSTALSSGLNGVKSKEAFVRIIDRRAPRAKTLHAFNATVNSDSAPLSKLIGFQQTKNATTPTKISIKY